MKESIKSVFSRVFNVPLSLIHDDVSFGDLSEWDSAGHRKLISELEREFQIKIDPEERQEMISFRNVTAVVLSYLDEDSD